MSITEIYEAESIDEAMDIAEHNCATCMQKCSNMRCPNMRALMDVSEKKEMTDEQKKRYFRNMGG